MQVAYIHTPNTFWTESTIWLVQKFDGVSLTNLQATYQKFLHQLFSNLLILCLWNLATFNSSKFSLSKFYVGCIHQRFSTKLLYCSYGIKKLDQKDQAAEIIITVWYWPNCHSKIGIAMQLKFICVDKNANKINILIEKLYTSLELWQQWRWWLLYIHEL